MEKYLIVLISILLVCVPLVRIITSKHFEVVFFSKPHTDAMRGLAAIFVMYSHYYPYLKLDGGFSIVYVLGYVGVSIFLFLSGYTSMMSRLNKKEYLKHYWRKRLLRLYVPFLIIYSICIIELLIKKTFTISSLVTLPLLSLPGHLNWYLKIQLMFYLVFWILAKIYKSDNKLLISMTILVAVYMTICLFINIESFWWETSFAFPLGMFMAKNQTKMYLLTNRKYFLILSLIPVVISFFILYFKGGVLSEVIFNASSIVFFTGFCAKFRHTSKLLCFIGERSLELYLSHLIVLEIVTLLLPINIWSFLIFLCLSFFLAVITNFFSRKIYKVIVS